MQCTFAWVAGLGLVVALVAAAASCGPTAATPAVSVRPTAPAQLIPPLHDAEAGEWVTYVRGTGEGEHLVQIRVVGTTDTTVTMEQTTYLGGVPQGRPATFEWGRNGFGMPEGGVIRAFERDHLEIDGKFVPCWRLRVHSRNDLRVYWISEDVPVHGVLQIDRVVKGHPEGNPFLLREQGFGEE